jgi:hypothetical protein
MNIDFVKILKYVVLVPIALLWDILYTGITYLYKGAQWVDTEGGRRLDKLINGENNE